MSLVLPASARIAPTPLLSSGWGKVANPFPSGIEAFRHYARQLTALRGLEDGRWHLSVSHRDRVPTWDELGFARDALLPADLWLMVAHPPRKYWLNFDRRVLHLWEFDDAHLVEQFKAEGLAAQAAGFGAPDSGEKER